MISAKTKILVAWIALLFSANNVFAASFDCKNARGDIEIAICSNEALSMLDSAIGQSYRKLFLQLNEDERARLRNNQRAWLGRRSEYCKIDIQSETIKRYFVDCLTEVYKQRISVLSGENAKEIATDCDACTICGVTCAHFDLSEADDIYKYLRTKSNYSLPDNVTKEIDDRYNKIDSDCRDEVRRYDVINATAAAVYNDCAASEMHDVVIFLSEQIRARALHTSQ